MARKTWKDKLREYKCHAAHFTCFFGLLIFCLGVASAASVSGWYHVKLFNFMLGESITTPGPAQGLRVVHLTTEFKFRSTEYDIVENYCIGFTNKTCHPTLDLGVINVTSPSVQTFKYIDTELTEFGEVYSITTSVVALYSVIGLSLFIMSCCRIRRLKIWRKCIRKKSRANCALWCPCFLSVFAFLICFASCFLLTAGSKDAMKVDEPVAQHFPQFEYQRINCTMSAEDKVDYCDFFLGSQEIPSRSFDNNPGAAWWQTFASAWLCLIMIFATCGHGREIYIDLDGKGPPVFIEDQEPERDVQLQASSSKYQVNNQAGEGEGP